MHMHTHMHAHTQAHAHPRQPTELPTLKARTFTHTVVASVMVGNTTVRASAGDTTICCNARAEAPEGPSINEFLATSYKPM